MIFTVARFVETLALMLAFLGAYLVMVWIVNPIMFRQIQAKAEKAAPVEESQED